MSTLAILRSLGMPMYSKAREHTAQSEGKRALQELLAHDAHADPTVLNGGGQQNVVKLG
jgi:hypothetical protein